MSTINKALLFFVSFGATGREKERDSEIQHVWSFDCLLILLGSISMFSWQVTTMFFMSLTGGWICNESDFNLFNLNYFIIVIAHLKNDHFLSWYKPIYQAPIRCWYLGINLPQATLYIYIFNMLHSANNSALTMCRSLLSVEELWRRIFTWKINAYYLTRVFFACDRIHWSYNQEHTKISWYLWTFQNNAH